MQSVYFHRQLIFNFDLLSIGLSRVQYSRIGIIVRFLLVNGFQLFCGGVRENFRKSRLRSFFSLANLIFGLVLVLYSIFDHVTFFSMVGPEGLKVNYCAHVFTHATSITIIVI